MCLHDEVTHPKRKDRGFMGLTHALSGFALLLALVAFAPWYVQWSGLSSPALIILAAMVMAGAALLPDLDNSVSTAKNRLGLLGAGLSIVFRGSATAVQTIVRTKRDDNNIDPHRGFWHTIPAAALIGLLVWLLTSIPGDITLWFFGDVTFGWIGGVLISFMCIHLAFAGLFSKILKKLIKGSGALESVLIGATTVGTLGLFYFIPNDMNFWWLAVTVAVGMVAHILGDAFTTAGVPILFPLSGFIKGKFWWKTRFLPIKAGGTVENMVFIPLFALISIGSLIAIIVQGVAS